MFCLFGLLFTAILFNCLWPFRAKFGQSWISSGVRSRACFPICSGHNGAASRLSSFPLIHRTCSTLMWLRMGNIDDETHPNGDGCQRVCEGQLVFI